MNNNQGLREPEFSNVKDFDYFLPDELIAQFPLEKRDEAKMLVVSRAQKTFKDKIFSDFIDYLKEEDVLVLNNTKVIPARLLGQKETGAKIEIFLLHPAGNIFKESGSKNLWFALIKNLKRLKTGDIVKISDEFSVKLLEKSEATSFGPDENLVELIYDGNSLDLILEKYGDVPLPPYIARANVESDKKNYQTVFAEVSGSVAAPTAGLHFTEENLEKIKNKGVKIAYITLNVGLGTFLPVKCENILDHKMHTESFEISKEAAEIINGAKGSIVAVGTTVARTLEATFQKYGKILPVQDETDIFIYPPFKFKVADKLLTNFHLPQSTLIMLVSALAGRDTILAAYNHAVKEKYRFFSYGDCMLIE